MTLALGILNTSIITTTGLYSLENIELEQAKTLVADAKEIDSAIGHQSTTEIMNTLLESEKVYTNRQNFSQQVGQKALVFKLDRRPPEGVILTKEEINKIGYHWQVMTRLE